MLFCLVGLASGAWAAELEVSDAWIRLVPAGAPADGYFKIRNGASKSVALVGASSSAFGNVVMHLTRGTGLSRMFPLTSVDVPMRGTLVFVPGGHHLMLHDPNRTLAVGDEIPITLEFSNKQKITVPFAVRGPAGK